jgi:hypothetical protein
VDGRRRLDLGLPQTRLKERISLNRSRRHHRKIDASNDDTRTILWLLADILDEVRQIRLQLEDEDDEEDDDR